MPSFGGSSQSRDQTHASLIAGGFFTSEPRGKPLSWPNRRDPVEVPLGGSQSELGRSLPSGTGSAPGAGGGGWAARPSSPCILRPQAAISEGSKPSPGGFSLRDKLGRGLRGESRNIWGQHSNDCYLTNSPKLGRVTQWPFPFAQSSVSQGFRKCLASRRWVLLGVCPVIAVRCQLGLESSQGSWAGGARRLLLARPAGGAPELQMGPRPRGS